MRINDCEAADLAELQTVCDKISYKARILGNLVMFCGGGLILFNCLLNPLMILWNFAVALQGVLLIRVANGFERCKESDDIGVWRDALLTFDRYLAYIFVVMVIGVGTSLFMGMLVLARQH